MMLYTFYYFHSTKFVIVSKYEFNFLALYITQVGDCLVFEISIGYFLKLLFNLWLVNSHV